jgi:diguanylate cyclase (GGDEF)-like protein
MLLYSLKYRKAENSYFFILLSLQLFLYIFGYFLELVSDNFYEAFYSVRMQYMGFPFILSNSYLFLRDIFGQKKVTKFQLFLLFIFPMISSIGMQTYPYQRLFYEDVQYVSNTIIANAQITPGPLYHIHVVYQYCVTVCILGLLFEAFFGDNSLMKKQSVPLLIGFSLPIFTSVIYVMAETDKVRFDYTPLATLVTIIMLVYSSNNHNLLRVMPIVKDQVIDTMADGFIVFDMKKHYIDANTSAKRIFPELNKVSAGESIPLLEQLLTNKQIVISVDEIEQIYEVSQIQEITNFKQGGYYIVLHDVTEKEQLLKELHVQATMDYLTDIYNRRAFFDKAEQLLIKNQGDAGNIALLLDIDNFKQINDRYGHPCGDKILQVLSYEMRQSMQGFQQAVFGRYGGEEFSFLFTSIDIEQAKVIAEMLRQKISETDFTWVNQKIEVTVSIGISVSNEKEKISLEDLLLQADVALYEAKTKGRNQVCLYKNTQEMHINSSAK